MAPARTVRMLLLLLSVVMALCCQWTNGQELSKRPFCNAFTGCGRKRAQSEAVPLGDGYLADAPLYLQQQLALNDPADQSSRLPLSWSALWGTRRRFEENARGRKGTRPKGGEE